MSIGRPKKSSEENLNVLMPVRFREIEGNMLKQLANLHKVSVSKYIRLQILKSIELPDEAVDEDLRDRYRPRERGSYSAIKQ